MELTIYNTYIVMESQEQCDRMKQLCIDNNLPIWDYFLRYWEWLEENNIFGFKQDSSEFVVHKEMQINKTQVTEDQFIELLKSNK